MADRIGAVLTDETRRAILQIKYDTPDEVKIMGIEYYQAVLRDGVRTYAEVRSMACGEPRRGAFWNGCRKPAGNTAPCTALPAPAYEA